MGIKEEIMDVDDSSDKPFKVGKIKTEIKKEDPDDIGTPRRRSSRLSRESINYDEDVLSEKREKKVKEEVDTKRKKKTHVIEDESDEETETILEKVNDDDEIIPRRRSGRDKNKPVNRKIESSDSEEEIIEVKKEPTRKKRKSTEMEKEIGQEDKDVKRTRSGRVVRTLINLKQATSTRSF